MNNLSELTIGILTYQRPQRLRLCLASLSCQRWLPRRVLIIDSGSQPETEGVVRDFEKKLPLTYQRLNATNLAVLRNRVLTLATTRWVAFIDDDCVLDSWWSEVAARHLSSNYVAVQGSDYPLRPTNVYSMLNLLYILYWKYQMSQRWRYPGRTLDTKNLILDREWLHTKRVKFDEDRRLLDGVGEDIDLGLQIEDKGGMVSYDRSLRVRHYEPTTVAHFLAKNKVALQASASVNTKWRTTTHFSTPFYSFFWRYLKNSTTLSLWQKVMMVLVHTYVSVIKRIAWRLNRG